MAEILTFPTPSARSGAVRAALEAIPASRAGKPHAVTETARQMARHTVTHHRLDAFAKQCETVFKRASKSGAEVIPFPRPPRSGDA